MVSFWEKYFRPQGLLVVSVFLFLINQLAEHQGLHFKWISSYLDDVLCMPIVLGLTLLIFKSFRGKNYIFPVGFIGLSTAYVGLMAEFVFPKYSDAFTYDPYDFIAYGIGACLFFFLGNKSS